MNEALISDESIRKIPDFCLAYNLGKAYRLILRPYERAFKGKAVTLMQYGLLVHINRNEPVTGRKLGFTSGHDPSTISRNLEKLILLQLVQVDDQIEQDKRQKHYNLTIKGKLVLQESAELWERTTKALQEIISEKTWTETLALLKNIQNLLEK